MISFPHSLEWLGECCRMMKRMVFCALFMVPVCLSAETNIPVLTTDTKLATAGYYQLSWQPGVTGALNKKPHFELQQSTDKTFRLIKTIYRGPDRASVISGQPDGEYYYRVRSVNPEISSGGWSKPVLVKVQHHSLQKAWLFFIAGAIVFFITLSFIVSSARSYDRG